MRLFTIGHSNHSFETFAGLLNDNMISMVVDVRTSPYSRYNPQFNKDNLASRLKQREIEYIFAGQYLGGRPTDPSCYKKGEIPEAGADYLHEVDYREIMQRSWFVAAIDRLMEIAREQTLATMCSEEDPAQCHRHHLISKYLMEQHSEVSIKHIRGNGTVIDSSWITMDVDGPSYDQLTLF